MNTKRKDQINAECDHAAEVAAKENRELEAWIAEHVMGYEKCPPPDDTGWHDGDEYFHSFEPTSNPAAAMEVLKKCAIILSEYDEEEYATISFEVPNVWAVEKCNCLNSLRAESSTLELAICRFAKKLFSK